MPKNNFEKTAIRERMAETNESYMTARRVLEQQTWFDIYRDGTGGFAPGLHLVCGRPKVGRTTFLMRTASRFNHALFLGAELGLSELVRWLQAENRQSITPCNDMAGFMVALSASNGFDAFFVDNMGLLHSDNEAMLLYLHKAAIQKGVPVFVGYQIGRTIDEEGHPIHSGDPFDALPYSELLASSISSVTTLLSDRSRLKFATTASNGASRRGEMEPPSGR